MEHKRILRHYDRSFIFFVIFKLDIASKNLMLATNFSQIINTYFNEIWRHPAYP